MIYTGRYCSTSMCHYWDMSVVSSVYYSVNLDATLLLGTSMLDGGDEVTNDKSQKEGVWLRSTVKPVGHVYI